MTSTMFWAEVDADGRLVLSPDVAARFRLTPGSRLAFSENGGGLRLHRPVSQLTKIYIEPSSLCNLDCRTCIRNVWDEPLDIMTQATFDRIMAGLAEFSPPPTIFFGGLGEPLTHPSLVDWVAAAKAAGARAELITNGTMLTERMSRRLIEAGLDMLWVSLDGATPESYADVRLGASLPKVLANIRQFNALRPNRHDPAPELGLAFVAMQRNIADLPAIMDIAKQVGASRLSVSNVLPYTANMESEILYARVLNNSTRQPSKYAPHLSLPKMNPNSQFGQLLGQIMERGWVLNFAGGGQAASNTCPFIEDGTLAIGWDGSVSPCLPLLHNHSNVLDERRRVSRRYIVGNLADQSLPHIWTLPEHVAFRQKVQAFDFAPCVFCGGCELSKTNETDCLGSSFPTCGGCLWAQGVIQCP